jgi:hypothetical protein
MKELINKQPVDLVYDVLTDFRPGTLDSEDLIRIVETRYGQPLIGFTRADLESLADYEIEQDIKIYGEMED